MNLNDFEKFVGTKSHNITDVQAGPIKSYIANKLREFGEKLKKGESLVISPDPHPQFREGWKLREEALENQIDKELSELQ